MKRFLIVFLVSLNVSLSSDEVLSEFVYYELTRADTKIEEKNLMKLRIY